MKKRILSVLLALAMLAGIVAATSLHAGAAASLNAALFKGKASDVFHGDIARVSAQVEKGEGFGLDWREYGRQNPWDTGNKSFDEFFGIPGFKIGYVTTGKTTLIAVRLAGTSTQIGTAYLSYLAYLPYHGYLVHAGFKAYADRVWAELDAFIAEHGFKNIKLLITGHSMGASCANLLGLRLADEKSIGGWAINAADVYVYGFESPAVHIGALGRGGKTTGNVFNLVNTADFLIHIAPGQRFGATYLFTCGQPAGGDWHNLSYAEFEAGIAAVEAAIKRGGGPDKTQWAKDFANALGESVVRYGVGGLLG